jgi:hypothetical protein
MARMGLMFIPCGLLVFAACLRDDELNGRL